MQKFRYRLESLLDLRKHYEREAEIKLAELTGMCIKLRLEIDALDAERTGLRGDSAAGGSLDMAALSASELYRKRLETRILTLTAELEELESRRQDAHVSYLSAMKEKKVLEKLRERKLEEHHREVLKNEAKVIDDIAGAAPARDRIIER